MTYKVRTTVQEPSRLVLDDLPFLPGQRVEVVVISEEDARLPPADALRDLLAKDPGPLDVRHDSG